jgi:exo-beta-1,3-glucanase (GH17 family)
MMHWITLALGIARTSSVLSSSLTTSTNGTTLNTTDSPSQASSSFPTPTTNTSDWAASEESVLSFVMSEAGSKMQGNVTTSQVSSNLVSMESIYPQISSLAGGNVSASQPSSCPSPNASSWSPYLNLPHYNGLNVVNQSPDNPGKFKNATEWLNAFGNIKALPGNWSAIRLYSTTDGDDTDPLQRHLELALPAAKEHDLYIHAGVWSGGDDNTRRFQIEKVALDRALQINGCGNIIAISVGNEDLYMNRSKEETGMVRVPLMSVNLLIDQVNEISALLDSHGCCHVPVTHTDTYGDWTKPEAVALVQAVDFLTVNIFPYWGGVSIDNANATLWEQMDITRDYAAKFGKEVWLGENGWPYNVSLIRSDILTQELTRGIGISDQRHCPTKLSQYAEILL